MSKIGRPTEEPKTEKIQMRVSPEFLKKLDNWRRKQEDLPNRTDAIRRLVDIGIDVSESLK